MLTYLVTLIAKAAILFLGLLLAVALGIAFIITLKIIGESIADTMFNRKDE